MDLIEVTQASDSRRQQLCLIDLHSDVLHLIFEQLYIISPQALCSLGLVCRRFRAHAVPHIFRQCNLSDKFVEYLLDGHGKKFRRHVRDISVKRELSHWESLVSLIQKLQHLAVFRWAVGLPMPAELAGTLNKFWPASKLYLDRYACAIWGRGGRTYPSDPHANSPCLYSIKADISYGCGATESEMKNIYNMLTTCPNIRFLDLSVRQLGCSISGTSPYTFDFQEGHRFPPLESLILNGYHFHDRRRCLRDFSGTNAALLDALHARGKVAGLEAWYNAMDWTQLRHLGLHDPEPEFLLRFYGCLPGLRSFQFIRDPETKFKEQLREAVIHFVSGLHKLEDLRLSGVGGQIPFETIIQHGSTLRALEIHEIESSEPEVQRQILTPDQLVILNENCPLLSNLSVDLYRDVQLPWEYLKSLSRFRRVRDIDLWAAMDLKLREEPHIDEDSARQVFDYFLSSKVGSPLRSVIVSVGEVSRRYAGPSLWGPPPVGKKFRCEFEPDNNVLVEEVV